ncbi:MAG: tRNA pseudouridine(38-40) synthase TruA [Acidobacteriota bacterium]
MNPPSRYRATVAYLGEGFHGWQIQKNASRTVQAVLVQAFFGLTRAPVRIEGASRTDAGVHADGQVIHFDLPRAREAHVIRDAINHRLPGDVRLLEVAVAAPDFHARHDALWKEYRYRWCRSQVVAPRDAPFVAPLSAGASLRRMRAAAAVLPGTRDFAVFAVKRTGEEDTRRTIHSVVVEEEGAELSALFRGNGFLRGMVRSICGVLADASRGRVPVERVAELLETGDRRRLSAKAPARGLTLVRVRYGE